MQQNRIGREFAHGQTESGRSTAHRVEDCRGGVVSGRESRGVESEESRGGCSGEESRGARDDIDHGSGGERGGDTGGRDVRCEGVLHRQDT